MNVAPQVILITKTHFKFWKIVTPCPLEWEGVTLFYSSELHIANSTLIVI